MIPVKYLKPCVKALSELVNNYGCSVVLCTATQPCLDGFFAEEGHEVREIAANHAALATALSRVRYQSDGAVADDALAQSLLGQHQALCIVNSRKQARALHDKLAEQSKDGLFHLTTMMHPLHRQKKIAEIKALLDAGQRCVVVATCLVEAGVDFDFPVVYRAVSGVDSLVQAGGRCNREGKREKGASIVHVFTPADHYVVPAEVEQRAAVAQSVMPSLLSASDSCLEVEDAVLPISIACIKPRANASWMRIISFRACRSSIAEELLGMALLFASFPSRMSAVISSSSKKGRFLWLFLARKTRALSNGLVAAC